MKIRLVKETSNLELLLEEIFTSFRGRITRFANNDEYFDGSIVHDGDDLILDIPSACEIQEWEVSAIIAVHNKDGESTNQKERSRIARIKAMINQKLLNFGLTQEEIDALLHTLV